MNALLYLLTIFVLTATIEFFVLRHWYPCRSLAFCIIVVGILSGIFWAAFSWTTFEMETGPANPRPVNEPPLVGSGLSWAVLLFVIWTLILSGVTLISASLVAIIYRRFRK